MNFSRSFSDRDRSRHAWPDLAASLAALVARVGSPVRLAVRLIERAQARTLRNDIAALEARVRARFHELFLHLVTIPDSAAALLESIAARAAARAATSAQQAAPSGCEPRQSQSGQSSAPAPSLMRLVAAPKPAQAPAVRRAPDSQPDSQRATRKLSLLQNAFPQPDDGVSAMPLARRLAALEQAIGDPHTTALNLLKTRPELVLDAGWNPSAAQMAAAENPPSRNRHQRRGDKVKAKAYAKQKLRLKRKPRAHHAPAHPEARREAARNSKDETRSKNPDTS